jgi:hypothetical protein
VPGNVNSTSTGSWIGVVSATISVGDNGIRREGRDNELCCGLGGCNLIFGALSGLTDRGGVRGNGGVG